MKIVEKENAPKLLCTPPLPKKDKKISSHTRYKKPATEFLSKPTPIPTQQLNTYPHWSN